MTNLSASADQQYLVAVSAKFSVVIPSGAGHQTPIVEYFRRLERIVRQDGGFAADSNSTQLTIVLSEKLRTNEYKFYDSQRWDGKVLEIPARLRAVLESPGSGRALTTALIRSRLGGKIDSPLPPEALWIADGLWAEFVLREKLPFHILHFSYLDGMRTLAEKDFKMRLNQQLLTAPQKIRNHSAEWVLYTQRAQLMLSVADSINPAQRGNLLKEYLYLLEKRQLAAGEVFNVIFAHNACRKYYPEKAAALKNSRRELDKLGSEALEQLALRNLFSGFAPMSPASLLNRLEKLLKITYQQDNGNPMTFEAALSDLPFLVHKYDSCAALPRQKIQQINEFAALVPTQLRGKVVNLARILSDLTERSPERASDAIKKYSADIYEELIKLDRTDRLLQGYELQLQTPLYTFRYSINNVMKQSLLPRHIREYINWQQQNFLRR